VVLGNISASNIHIGDRYTGRSDPAPEGQAPLPILMLTANPNPRFFARKNATYHTFSYEKM
jgi:hypothetical protein